MILVAGATGSLGFEIARRLKSKGEAVRALVRTTSAPEKIARLAALGVETVTGDLKDRASLRAACEGATAVISTVSIIGTAQAGDSFSDTDTAGTISLVDAAKAAGARRFVFISLDVDSFPSSPLVDGKRAAEEHLRASGLEFTVLRPSPFMETWLGPMLFGDASTGQVKVYGSGEGRVPYVSVADVAEVAVRALTADVARNATITFGGPESITQHEAVRMFEVAFGKPMTVTQVPEEALAAQWNGADNPFEKTFAGLMLGLARHNESPARLTGDLAFDMTTVQNFARKLAE